MLSLQEFDILNFLFKNQDKEYTQEEISNNTKISLGKVYFSMLYNLAVSHFVSFC